MRHRHWLAALATGLPLAIIAACSSFESTPAKPDADASTAETDTAARAGGNGDGSDDAAEANAPTCAWNTTFGAIAQVANLNDGSQVHSASFSADELAVVVTRFTPPSTYAFYGAVRSNPDAPFPTLAQLYPSVADGGLNSHATLTSDGLRIFFSTRPTGPDDLDIVTATRVARTDPFADASPPLTTMSDPAAQERTPFVNAQGNVYFISNRPNIAIYRAPFPEKGLLAEQVSITIPDATAPAAPVVSADELTMYVAFGVPSGTAVGAADIWVAHRESVDAGFGVPQLLAELQSAGHDTPTWLSPDGCRLYFVSDKDGTPGRLYVARRTP
jgi:hypothetical protein